MQTYTQSPHPIRKPQTLITMQMQLPTNKQTSCPADLQASEPASQQASEPACARAESQHLSSTPLQMWPGRHLHVVVLLAPADSCRCQRPAAQLSKQQYMYICIYRNL